MKMRNYLLGIFTILLAFIIMACGQSENANTNAAGNKDNVSFTNAANSGTAAAIDVNNSTVKWLGKKVTGQHNGTVNVKDGKIYLDNGKITGGEFNIDMTSIKVVDLTDAESNQKLTGHLKSNDFFSVENNPTAKFVITGIAPSSASGSNQVIKGDLTIKGITKPIQFPASVQVNNGKVTAKANFDIDRTEYDIKYGSGKFFEGIGDKAIYDNFNIDLDLVTN